MILEVRGAEGAREAEDVSEGFVLQIHSVYFYEYVIHVRSRKVMSAQCSVPATSICCDNE